MDSMFYIMIVFLALIVFAFYMIYREISKQGDITHEECKSIRIQINNLDGKISDNVNTTINKIKTLNADNIQQLQNIILLNNQPITKITNSNHFTETDSEYIKDVQHNIKYLSDTKDQTQDKNKKNNNDSYFMSNNESKNKINNTEHSSKSKKSSQNDETTDIVLYNPDKDNHDNVITVPIPARDTLLPSIDDDEISDSSLDNLFDGEDNVNNNNSTKHVIKFVHPEAKLEDESDDESDDDDDDDDDYELENDSETEDEEENDDDNEQCSADSECSDINKEIKDAVKNNSLVRPYVLDNNAILLLENKIENKIVDNIPVFEAELDNISNYSLGADEDQVVLGTHKKKKNDNDNNSKTTNSTKATNMTKETNITKETNMTKETTNTNNKLLMIKEVDPKTITYDNIRPVNEYYLDALKKMAKAYAIKLTNEDNKALKKEELYKKIKEHLKQ